MGFAVQSTGNARLTGVDCRWAPGCMVRPVLRRCRDNRYTGPKPAGPHAGIPDRGTRGEIESRTLCIFALYERESGQLETALARYTATRVRFPHPARPAEER